MNKKIWEKISKDLMYIGKALIVVFVMILLFEQDGVIHIELSANWWYLIVFGLSLSTAGFVIKYRLLGKDVQEK